MCYTIAMMKILTDVHTHTSFSPDGRDTIEKMLQTAHEKGFGYYGIAEHFDYDIIVDDIPPFMDGYVHVNPQAYFSRGRELQAEYAGKMHVLLGAECAYTDNPKAHAMYKKLCDTYAPDFVVNSLHCLPCGDYYRGQPFYNKDGSLRDKDEVYGEYFALIRRSLDVEYHYDILAHLTYCARYAPYEDRLVRWKDYSVAIDDILQTLIARGKILEVNTSNKGYPGWAIPNTEILERYFELGGRKISFASDAHFVSRIGDNREQVMDMLRAIGFEYITVPVRKKHVEVEI